VIVANNDTTRFISADVAPRVLLAAALKKIATTPAAAVEIADRAGDDMRRSVLRARAGKAINAGAFVALCAAVCIDPVDGARRPPKRMPACIAWPMVGAGLRIARRLRHQKLRSAAKLMGISATTLCRLEAGDAVSVESFLAACRFLGVHPEHYACENVSRETSGETVSVDRKGKTTSATQPLPGISPA
jgi:DNA-binding Xre family transcriptional regulator